MSYILNILKYTRIFARDILARQLHPVGLYINFNGSFWDPTLAVLANAKNASRLLVAARVHAPRYLEHNREGVAPEGRAARKKNSRSRLPIKKPPCSRGCTGLLYNVGGNPCTAKSIFSPGLSFPPCVFSL